MAAAAATPGARPPLPRGRRRPGYSAQKRRRGTPGAGPGDPPAASRGAGFFWGWLLSFGAGFFWGLGVGRKPSARGEQRLAGGTERVQEFGQRSQRCCAGRGSFTPTSSALLRAALGCWVLLQGEAVFLLDPLEEMPNSSLQFVKGSIRPVLQPPKMSGSPARPVAPQPLGSVGFGLVRMAAGWAKGSRRPGRGGSLPAFGLLEMKTARAQAGGGKPVGVS